uniref:Uncharacterized protein n=1 Tax=Leersia perrieri TaxID=77586 RepID=A0A0D9XQB4_9ORYZ
MSGCDQRQHLCASQPFPQLSSSPLPQKLASSAAIMTGAASTVAVTRPQGASTTATAVYPAASSGVEED